MRLSWLTALSVLALGSGTAMAAEGTLDCAAPGNPVEEAICQDEGLKAGDAKLEAAYQAAFAKIAGDPEEAEALRIEQRRWRTQGRDGCGFGDEVQSCVAREYIIRLSELQVTYGLVPLRSSTTYQCDGEPPAVLVANVYETEPPTLRLDRDGATLDAFEVPVPDGTRFEGGDVRFASDGSTAQVTWIEDELQCKAVSPP